MENDKVAIVMRQTNYTKEEAETQLLANNNNLIATIQAYIGSVDYSNLVAQTSTEDEDEDEDEDEEEEKEEDSSLFTNSIYSRIRQEFATQSSRPPDESLVAETMNFIKELRESEKQKSLK